MLDKFEVTEGNWRDACVKTPGFGISESPAYVGRGVAALAQTRLLGIPGRLRGEQNDGKGIDQFR
jgi:hypothetical protein